MSNSPTISTLSVLKIKSQHKNLTSDLKIESNGLVDDTKQQQKCFYCFVIRLRKTKGSMSKRTVAIHMPVID